MRRADPFADPAPLIRRVYAYVAYRMGEGADAEDVTSETFERAIRYRGSYEAKKGELLPWLFGIARRCVDDALAARQKATSERPDAVVSGLEEEAITRLDVAAAVADLDERDRELIALRYGADLTAAQIAELLGARTNTVEVALSRARARLATALGQHRVDERADLSESRKVSVTSTGSRQRRIESSSQEAPL